jgi:hypothetical protein
MPVIGRLDEQVNDIIIAPVSNRRSDEAPPPVRESEEAPQASEASEAPETLGAPHAPERSAATPTQTPPRVESSAESDELPVRLL